MCKFATEVRVQLQYCIFTVTMIYMLYGIVILDFITNFTSTRSILFMTKDDQ